MSSSCLLPGVGAANFPDPEFDPAPVPAAESAQLVLAGGCFWCTEAVFKRLRGVLEVVPGYAGGSAETASYDAVCSRTTGHAEVIRITYQPARISLGQLLKVFFSVAHDPTQLNRQGDDVGSQYRSAVFHADPQQHEIVRRYIEQLEGARVFSAPIVTVLEPLEAFYLAEDYHHDYAARNPGQAYIRAVAAPKVDTLQRWHGDKLDPS